MIELQYISDIHQDFLIAQLKKYNNDDLDKFLYTPNVIADNLIIAGDLWLNTNPLVFGQQNYKWLEKISKLYKNIIIVLGNHDYYGSTINNVVTNWKKLILEQNLNNVHFLNNDYIEIEKNKFIYGATFWPNFKNLTPYYTSLIEEKNNNSYFITDFKKIKNNAYGRIKVKDFIGEHIKSKVSLISFLNEHKDADIGIVTHFPLFNDSIKDLSYNEINLGKTEITEIYREIAKIADSSHCLELLEYKNINFHIHGHIHKKLNYKKEHINVYCNPYGYCGKDLDNNSFNDKKIEFTNNYTSNNKLKF